MISSIRLLASSLHVRNFDRILSSLARSSSLIPKRHCDDVDQRLLYKTINIRSDTTLCNQIIKRNK
jgi:hypothetical protein